MTAKDILKGWFSTGKKPTGFQFSEWIDSFWHKGEVIKITDVENLQNTLAKKVEGTDQRVANAVRYLNGVLTAPDGSTITVGSDFYFGTWSAGEFKAGWIAISSDGKKFWQCLVDHVSAAEPVAPDTNWKLVFEDTGGGAIASTDDLSEGTNLDRRYYTSNREDAAKNRANHTGTQTTATLTPVPSDLLVIAAGALNVLTNGVKEYDCRAVIDAADKLIFTLSLKRDANTVLPNGSQGTLVLEQTIAGTVEVTIPAGSVGSQDAKLSTNSKLTIYGEAGQKHFIGWRMVAGTLKFTPDLYNS